MGHWNYERVSWVCGQGKLCMRTTVWVTQGKGDAGAVQWVGRGQGRPAVRVRMGLLCGYRVCR